MGMDGGGKAAVPLKEGEQAAASEGVLVHALHDVPDPGQLGIHTDVTPLLCHQADMKHR